MFEVGIWSAKDSVRIWTQVISRLQRNAAQKIL